MKGHLPKAILGGLLTGLFMWAGFYVANSIGWTLFSYTTTYGDLYSALLAGVSALLAGFIVDKIK